MTMWTATLFFERAGLFAKCQNKFLNPTFWSASLLKSWKQQSSNNSKRIYLEESSVKISVAYTAVLHRVDAIVSRQVILPLLRLHHISLSGSSLLSPPPPSYWWCSQWFLCCHCLFSSLCFNWMWNWKFQHTHTHVNSTRTLMCLWCRHSGCWLKHTGRDGVKETAQAGRNRKRKRQVDRDRGCRGGGGLVVIQLTSWKQLRLPASHPSNPWVFLLFRIPDLRISSIHSCAHSTILFFKVVKTLVEYLIR